MVRFYCALSKVDTLVYFCSKTAWYTFNEKFKTANKSFIVGFNKWYWIWLRNILKIIVFDFIFLCGTQHWDSGVSLTGTKNDNMCLWHYLLLGLSVWIRESGQKLLLIGQLTGVLIGCLVGYYWILIGCLIGYRVLIGCLVGYWALISWLCRLMICYPLWNYILICQRSRTFWHKILIGLDGGY